MIFLKRYQIQEKIEKSNMQIKTCENVTSIVTK